MDDEQLTACLRLSALSGLSTSQKHCLLVHFKQPNSIFSAPLDEIKTLLAASGSSLRDIFRPPDPQQLAQLAQQRALLDSHRIQILLHHQPQYPALLRQIPDAPAVLYVRGNPKLLSGPQLAIVGSRHASPAGLKTARAFARDFSRSGLTITSGLAQGIDTAAHLGGLDEIGGTVAVVATGLDQIYPRSNLDLARAIVSKGVMISEFPPLTPARRANFPQRNRLISGLSLGVLVVEADTRSGSLITARMAGEQGRETFAIPGSIHLPTSRGCHQLIRQGAKLVETTADVLLELKPYLESELKLERDRTKQSVTKPENIDLQMQSVLNLVAFAPTSLLDISTDSNLSVELVSSILLQLELAGRVSPLPGEQYQRIPD